MKQLIIAEKPSVTKDLVAAIEPSAKYTNGYYEGENYVFTNAIGHLLRLKNPEEIGAQYKRWTLEQLPIQLHTKLIDNYTTNEKTLKQLELIKKLLMRNDFSIVINATDPDREGELIFSSLFAYLNCQLPTKRLILKDMTKEGIVEQFALMEPGEKYKGLKASAYLRAFSDYLVGMNMTRALTVKFGRGEVLSSGRVQTPTLKLIYDRTKENRGHKKKIHYVIKAKLADTEVLLLLEKKEFKTREEGEAYLKTLPEVLDIKQEKKKKKKLPPPLPNLLDIQKAANTKWGYKAEQALDIVQSLYEKHKAVTYPRTDCQIVTENTAQKLNQRRSKFSAYPNFDQLIYPGIHKKNIGQVTAHEAITPTGLIPKASKLSEPERNIYNEIISLYLANYCGDYEYNDIIYTAKYGKDVLKTTEKELLEEGYLKLYRNVKHKYRPLLPSGEYPVTYEVNEVESKPKPLFTEATLISKMENIHYDESGETKKILKDIKGIGTPATRGSIIETLFKRGYIVNKGKSIVTTKKGEDFIELLMKFDSQLLDVKYTADLETQLKEMLGAPDQFKAFFTEINASTHAMIDVIRKANHR